MAKRKKAAKNHNFQTTTKDTPEYRTWFRGEHTNYNPVREQMLGADAVPKYVLQGWEPKEACITTDTQITAFGSCFAANISNWLSNRNYRVLNKDENSKQAYVVSCGEGMVNSFVIRQQFEWAWENKVFKQALWHGYEAEEYGYDKKVQAETKRIFDETDVFILTFGLSEVWYDEKTKNVFWRTIPKDVYDPKRHKFRVSTVEENRDNLEAIYKLIRKHRPDAKIIFTLSPIPLIATFRDNSCITSNSVSKSILRVAIDETVRKYKDDGYLHYWPSYEIITDVFRQPYKPDRRHPPVQALDYIMTLFEHVWCKKDEENPPPSLTDAWIRGCAASGLLPERLEDIVIHRRKWRLRQTYKGPDLFDSNKRLDQLHRRMLSGVLSGWLYGEKDPLAKEEASEEK